MDCFVASLLAIKEGARPTMSTADKTWMAGTNPAMRRSDARIVGPSLRAQRSNPSLCAGIDGLLRRFAPRNDGRARSTMSTTDKTWMAGTSPAMTTCNKASAPKPLRQHLFQDLPLDGLVGQRGVVPPPAVALHLLGRRHKAVGHLGEVRIRVVEAEYQPAGSDPAQRQPLGAQIVLKHPVVAGRFGILHHPRSEE